MHCKEDVVRCMRTAIDPACCEFQFSPTKRHGVKDAASLTQIQDQEFVVEGVQVTIEELQITMHYGSDTHRTRDKARTADPWKRRHSPRRNAIWHNDGEIHLSMWLPPFR